MSLGPCCWEFEVMSDSLQMRAPKKRFDENCASIICDSTNAYTKWGKPDFPIFSYDQKMIFCQVGHAWPICLPGPNTSLMIWWVLLYFALPRLLNHAYMAGGPGCVKCCTNNITWQNQSWIKPSCTVTKVLCVHWDDNYWYLRERYLKCLYLGRIRYNELGYNTKLLHCTPPVFRGAPSPINHDGHKAVWLSIWW